MSKKQEQVPASEQPVNVTLTATRQTLKAGLCNAALGLASAKDARIAALRAFCEVECLQALSDEQKQSIGDVIRAAYKDAGRFSEGSAKVMASQDLRYVKAYAANDTVNGVPFRVFQQDKSDVQACFPRAKASGGSGTKQAAAPDADVSKLQISPGFRDFMLAVAAAGVMDDTIWVWGAANPVRIVGMMAEAAKADGQAAAEARKVQEAEAAAKLEQVQEPERLAA